MRNSDDTHVGYFTLLRNNLFSLPPLPINPQRLFAMHYTIPSQAPLNPAFEVTHPLNLIRARGWSRKGELKQALIKNEH